MRRRTGMRPTPAAGKWGAVLGRPMAAQVHAHGSGEQLLHEVSGEDGRRSVYLAEHLKSQALVEWPSLKSVSVQPHLAASSNACFLLGALHEIAA